MVAKKLLVNSITKVEEGEKQKSQRAGEVWEEGWMPAGTPSYTNSSGERIQMLLEFLHAVFEPGQESELISGHLSLKSKK